MPVVVVAVGGVDQSLVVGRRNDCVGVSDDSS